MIVFMNELFLDEKKMHDILGIVTSLSVD
jgi:hypothetical protein